MTLGHVAVRFYGDLTDMTSGVDMSGTARLLTRDRGLLMRSIVTHGYLVRADDPREQVLEVACGQVYRPGSHVAALRVFVQVRRRARRD